MKFSVLHVFYVQLQSTPPVIREDLSGKTAIVLGANTGIGYETAKHFATMNTGRLILACRSQARGEVALQKLRQETDCKTAELWLVDLASFASVNAFAQRFEKDGGRLDVLVANAGISPEHDRAFTQDGWESALQTNHLSTSLFVLLLLPKMFETAQKHNVTPRISVVSSDMHLQAKLDKKVVERPDALKYFGSKEFFDPAENSFSDGTARYSDTKLLNVLFARALGARLTTKPNPPSVIVDAVNPGYCYTTNLRNSFNTPILKFINWLMEKVLARTAEEGARQVVWAALAGGLDGEKTQKKVEMNGGYVSEMHLEEVSDYVLSDEGKIAEDKLWDNLVDELANVNPKVRSIVSQYLVAPSAH